MKESAKFCMLIVNEFIKIFTKAGIWILIVLVFGSMIFVTIKAKPKVSRETYRSEIIKQLDNQKKELGNISGKDAVKDSDSLSSIVKKDYVIKQYAYTHNKMYDSTSLWNIVEFAGIIKYVIGLFIAVMAATIMSNEYKEGTIKFLLMRPIERWKVLLSKYISVILLYFFLIFLTMFMAFILGGVKYGFNTSGVSHLYLSSSGTVKEMNMLLYEILSILGNSVSDIMAVTIAFTMSTIIKSNALAIVASIGTVFSGAIFTMLGDKFSWVKYTPFPHMDLNQYMPGMSPLLKGNTLGFSLIIVGLYFILFNAISYIWFCKRDIS